MKFHSAKRVVKSMEPLCKHGVTVLKMHARNLTQSHPKEELAGKR